MKQTAVEWLQEQLKDVKYNPLETNGYSNALERLYDQAKEMEKQQIIEAFKRGTINEMNGIEEITSEGYYNETFKNK